MIRLDTGTPGAGKTLINVDDIVKLEKTNKKNIVLNPKIHEQNLKLLAEKDLLSELEYLIRKVGQGVDLRDQPFTFDPNYFELFKSTDRVEDYFLRSIYYNEIIDRVNKEHDLKLQHMRPVRTIYTNIAGLEIDTIRPIPPDADWRKLPDGSYVVYDEIQNIPIFSSENRSVDPIVKDLTIHRHRGFDIVGITQFPDLVHKNFRAVTGHHRHLVNSFGLKRSTLYEWSTVKLDPNAFKNKATSEIKTTYAFPPELYKYYRSSTAHTHKRRLPWRFIFTLCGVLVFCFSLFMCSFRNDNNIVKQIATGEPAHADKSNKSATSQPSGSKQTDSKTTQNQNATDSGGAASEPVVPVESTYSASDPFAYEPVYVPEPVNHRVFSGCLCIKNSCSAYDQQGTKISGINPKVCRDLIKDSSSRPFDYFNTRTERVSTSEQQPSAS
ncbi:zonular occludens toxin [Acinetobacter proteolyticus]|uniref:zonular occludens toxin domain-containing protein n=1 Tax=Acinetobacter proteolyticus TaxID=1776741 RepID=UPI0008634281|nr:zonular occludens toxin domain-containing protein [Acinetobacter proteolyticus]OEY93802.1 zonular occludens toxin [Acinetobacter proteolyticus]